MVLLINLSTPTRVGVELGCVRLRLWLGSDNIIIYGGGGSRDLYFFLHISSSQVKIRLHTENQLPRLPGSALKVQVWCAAGAMWWMLQGLCGGPTNNLVQPIFSCFILSCGQAVTILSYYTDICRYSGGSGDLYFFLHISSSQVKIRLHTENQLPRLSGSALKV